MAACFGARWRQPSDLPAITLGAALAAILSAWCAASMIEELSSDYVRTLARKASRRLPCCSGTLSQRADSRDHDYRIASMVRCWQHDHTNRFFPGPALDGSLMQAISARDYPLLQAAFL